MLSLAQKFVAVGVLALFALVFAFFLPFWLGFLALPILLVAAVSLLKL